MHTGGAVPVRIVLESSQEGAAPSMTRHTGLLYNKPKSIFIRYDEQEQQGGESAAVGTTIRWDGQELKLIRRGAVESEQSFVAGRRTGGIYRSALAEFRLETETTYLTVVTPQEALLPIAMEWHYQLWLSGEHAGQFQIRLTLQEE
ncbi:DUF1934 domain-containing protein [Paenibacillus sambharensis]|uniref:DUF1934 domain-containing protein n=1 Tax=Paenibacillus sambharensis TaxID=1803190 RepID=A0A2W1LXP1_9BACL|nr:DUF1934 domain-containing protein [Paenibacillus sambharensis]PZD96461.1 DUF1934 domain-containing protein [Paenibacillus sambharensis]